MLTWSKVKGAVIYEIEFLPSPLPDFSENSLSDKHLFSTRQVYSNGYNPDLKEFAASSPIYWRVRGLNFDGEAISNFSEPEKLFFDDSVAPVNSPVPNDSYGDIHGSTLLYPVYSWLPIAHAAQYEVELLDAPPENPNGTTPSIHRIWSAITELSDKYDDKARYSSKPFYWRVRGLDKDGNPVGVYSDAQEFSINPDAGWEIATFGDSISHGGGSLSYSPVDWEYSYQTYLDFPVVNLSCSGDTSETAVDRFDADVLPFHPRYLIILEGSNSIRGGTAAEEVISDLKTLKAKCENNNIVPIFMTLPPINPASIEKVFNEPTAENWREEMDKVNQYIRTETINIDLASRLNYPDGILPPALALDGLHPDINVKKKMAAIINAELPKILTSQK
ncbi:MAG: SGNH/GDSL hydrolase family protein [Acidaminococcaceae bacterium]